VKACASGQRRRTNEPTVEQTVHCCFDDDVDDAANVVSEKRAKDDVSDDCATRCCGYSEC
jgi:hypothetical protein